MLDNRSFSPSTAPQSGPQKVPPSAPALQDLGCPKEQHAPPSTAALRDALDALSSPLDQRDDRTGLRTRFPLLTSRGCQELEQTLGSVEKLMLFLDVGNMGPPQRYSVLVEATDRWLSRLPKLAAEAFGSLPYELFRTGGDEFVLLAAVPPADRDAPIKAAEQLLSYARRERDRLFPENHPDVRAAEGFSRLRNGVRRALKCFLHVHPRGTAAELHQWLQESYPADYPLVREKIAANPTQRSDLHPAKLLRHLVSRQLLNVDAASIVLLDAAYHVLREPLSPTGISKALGALDKTIHIAKAEGRRGQLTPLSETTISRIELRAADQAEIEHAERTNSQWEQLSAEHEFPQLLPPDRLRSLIQDRLAFSGSDPSVPGVLRHNLIRRVPAEVVLDGVDLHETSALRVDINSFGVLNNSFRYSRADHMYFSVVEAVLAGLPRDQKVVRVRTDGGGLVVLGVLRPDKETLDQLEDAANRALRRQVDLLHVDPDTDGDTVAFAKLEHLSRQSLEEKVIEPQHRPILGRITLTLAALPSRQPRSTFGAFLNSVDFQERSPRRGATEAVTRE